MQRFRGTCVALEVGGVLLRGASGRGKSDMALRLIQNGARLVSDDYTDLDRRGDELWGTAPETISGLFEVHGIGIVRLKPQKETIIKVVIELAPADAVSRMPEPRHIEIERLQLPLYQIAPFEVSAEAKVRLMMDIVNGGIVRVS